MDRAIILHGMMSEKKYHDLSREDSSSNCHWIPWLQHQLCARDILAQTPELPKPYSPNYDSWKEIFERFELNESCLLVGHSCGGGFLVRWLSENPNIIVNKVVLVAPWLDIEKSYSPLFDFDLRTNISDQSKNGIDILCSTNDSESIKSSIIFLQNNLLDAKYHEFIDYGHFRIEEMKTRVFPELLQICLG